MNYFKLLSILIFFSPVVILSQTKTIPSITINPDTRSIGLPPFDREFTINSFSTDYTAIKFEYQLISRNPKGRLYNISGSQDLDINITSKMAHFIETIGPLHPDKAYKFSLIAKKNITLTTEELNVLNNETYNLIENYFPKFSDANPATTSQFRQDIIDLLRKTAKSDQIFDAVNQPYVIGNISDAYLGNAIFKNVQMNKAIALSQANMDVKRKLIKTKLQTDNVLFERLADIDDGRVKLSKRATEFYKAPVNVSIKNNEKVNLKDMLSFLLTDEVSIVNAVLSGNNKIKGTTLENNNGVVDYNSVLLLKSTFEKIGYTRIMKDNQGNQLIDPSLISTVLKPIITDFKDFVSEYENNIYAKESKKKIKAIIPNILKELFIKENVNINKTILIDVVAEKNAYIGLDLGILFASEVSGVFSFQSANFYFVPVNREAPFSNYQKSDRFFKRFSLYLGVAQLLSDQPEDYNDLFASNSLIMGLGYRLTRTLRISAGGLMYKKIDTSPVSNDSSIAFSPTVALSIDIDLTKALGALGTVFKN